MNNRKGLQIGVIGLGYVGLPLAIELGKYYDTIGFDVDVSRIAELLQWSDRTLEVSAEEFKQSEKLRVTTDSRELRDRNFYIVTVPTPVDEDKIPDLSAMVAACETVGRLIDRQDIVVFESTVFPGATEEICVPILEFQSGLRFNVDFFCGYSPERINPGDKQRGLINTVKITSGSNSHAAKVVDDLYKSIIKAGTHLAKSIKIAEAAKVIENTQRDVNIALVNELSLIFTKLGISTEDVLKAAETKWNFIPFRPGLVGGHCIGVDPYYLTSKAIEVGYDPQLILAGRQLNDEMGRHLGAQIRALMLANSIATEGSKILVMGLTFKENCPDIRNTKVVDLVDDLKASGAVVDVYDPWVNANVARDITALDLITEPKKQHYDCVVIAVAHSEFSKNGPSGVRQFAKKKSVIYDIKYMFSESDTDGRP